MTRKQTQQGPADFVRWLAALCLRRTLCVECGAGRAELSRVLAPLFNQVTAIDATPPPVSRQYHPVAQCRAEALPFGKSSVDLLFSMQAAHHFDLPAHVDEAKRVLRPGGVFGVFSWSEIELPTQVQQAYEPVMQAINRFWEPERDWVTSGYKGFAFPGIRMDMPPLYLTKWLTPERLELEMASWSAVQAACRADIDFPEPRFEDAGLDQQASFPCRWRIVGQVFRC